MAEVEASVPPPQEAASSPAAEEPTYDESLLIFVKGKVKPPVEPDRTERDLIVANLQAEISKHSERIKQIKEAIDAKRSSARGISEGQSEYVTRLKVLRDEFQNVLRRKQQVREERVEYSKEREGLRNRLRAIKEDTKGISLDNVERQIQETEHKINHETLSSTDEKMLMQKLQKLQQARGYAGEWASITARMAEIEQLQNTVTQKLQQCDELLTDIKAKEEKEKSALSSIRNKEQGEVADLPTLNVEKAECWDIIQACRKKIDEVRNEHNQKYSEFIKLDRNYKAYMRWDKKKKYEERKAEREKRMKEREERDGTGNSEAVNFVREPYEQELFTLDQLLAYLKGFVADSKDVAVETAQKEIAAPEKGMVLFKRKDDADDDFYSSVSKKGKGKKTGPKDDKNERKVVDKKLNHDLDTLKTFMSLAIEVPQTTANIPKTIEAAEARKAHFLELREKVKSGEIVPEANGHGHDEEQAEAEAGTEDATATESANGFGASVTVGEEGKVHLTFKLQLS